jgi:hypothetical protein
MCGTIRNPEPVLFFRSKLENKRTCMYRSHPLFCLCVCWKIWVVRDIWFLVFFYIFWCFEHVKKLFLLLLGSRLYQRESRLFRLVLNVPERHTQEKGGGEEHENNCNTHRANECLMGKDTRNGSSTTCFVHIFSSSSSYNVSDAKWMGVAVTAESHQFQMISI